MDDLAVAFTTQKECYDPVQKAMDIINNYSLWKIPPTIENNDLVFFSVNEKW